jgi:myo-inositol 2-dehydrogenase / D-chiro-inositol 1-dehydrogenase
MPLKIAVLGAGDHSQMNHLPALAAFMRQHPGIVEHVGLCDLRFELAQSLAAQYGFQQAFPDLESMLSAAAWDSCIAITPVVETAPIAERILKAGVPLLMEKPPGKTPQEARALAGMAQDLAVPVMVSMNRRFDPALHAGLAWIGERRASYVHAVQIRHARREPEFITDTAIHAIDTLRYLAGDVRSWHLQVQPVAGVMWYVVSMTFENGVTGSLEVLPDGGHTIEQYDLIGEGFHVQVRAGGVDTGEVYAWQNGNLASQAQLVADQPEYIADGCLTETTAFILSILEAKPLQPSLDQVLSSVELCHAIKTAVAKDG